MVHAAEDIGMANPEALTIATNAMLAAERIGMPEIRIILSEATIYLAITSKSNSSYNAVGKALEDINNGLIEEVPNHLKDEFKEQYVYPHNYEGSL
jgi:putative ATPase